ncbi:hypothetical protein ACJ73_00786 [Blastomyces percursus]|uniref:Uncharacterized protein n=1 Tax=Blastomyces percursus TaxID=1658174 RepID=A0A1J9QG57_9EURO|nr:hypothetical protein ACJ73_00786 [Blastomyces percursus]
MGVLPTPRKSQHNHLRLKPQVGHPPLFTLRCKTRLVKLVIRGRHLGRELIHSNGVWIMRDGDDFCQELQFKRSSSKTGHRGPQVEDISLVYTLLEHQGIQYSLGIPLAKDYPVALARLDADREAFSAAIYQAISDLAWSESSNKSMHYSFLPSGLPFLYESSAVAESRAKTHEHAVDGKEKIRGKNQTEFWETRLGLHCRRDLRLTAGYGLCLRSAPSLQLASLMDCIAAHALSDLVKTSTWSARLNCTKTLKNSIL